MRACCWRSVLACAVLIGAGACSNTGISKVAEKVGGGALPPSRGSIFDKPAEAGEGRSKIRRSGGRAVGEQAQPELEAGPDYYFGRRDSRVLDRGRSSLTPSFNPDGSCRHCEGRGFRFVDGDYAECEGCDGVGTR